MNRLIPALLLSTACFLRADFVVEKRIESFEGTSVLSIKLKGDKLRMDVPGKTGISTALADGNSGQLVTLVHNEKVALVSPVEGVPSRPKRPVPQDRGKDARNPPLGDPIGHEKIGDWNCAVYSRTRNGITEKNWVTNDISIYPRLRAQMESVMANIPNFNIDGVPIAIRLPSHVVVKRVVSGPRGVKTESVIKISEEPVADSEFVRPADYREVEFPAKAKTGPAAPPVPGTR